MHGLQKTGFWVAATAVAGLVLIVYLLKSQDISTVPGTGPDPAVYFDANAPSEQRIRALEIAVGEERNARQLLEVELRVVLEKLDDLTAGTDPVGDSDGEEDGLTADSQDSSGSEDVRETSRQRRDERFSPEGRIQSLVDAGFSPDRAALIAQREAELQMAAMQARFEARRNGEQLSPDDPSFNSEAMLRAEIGDNDYELYLEANNRSTSVGVGSVLQSSPAQVAGLQSGDRIVRYDGERVFSMNDLYAQTMQGSTRQNVVVDIERDGVPMQFVLPPGPLGITGGRRYSENRR